MGQPDRFLGVARYSPRHIQSMTDLRQEDLRRFRDLVGARLRRTWAVWDTVDDEWFVDGPIALDFGEAGILELAAFKLHLCVSWNSIDLDDPIEWYPGSDFALEWRADVLEPFKVLCESTVTSIELVEFACALNGVAVRTDDHFAEAFNGLDELAVRSAPEIDDEVLYRAP